MGSDGWRTTCAKAYRILGISLVGPWRVRFAWDLTVKLKVFCPRNDQPRTAQLSNQLEHEMVDFHRFPETSIIYMWKTHVPNLTPT